MRLLETSGCESRQYSAKDLVKQITNLPAEEREKLEQLRSRPRRPLTRSLRLP